MKKFAFLLFVLIAFRQEVSSQHNSTLSLSDIITELMEDLVSENESDYEIIMERLLFISENKINLNKANYEELCRIPVLSQRQIYGILLHRKKYGKFMSLYELKNIPELTTETIHRILPFITVETKEEFSPQQIFRHRKNQLLLRYDRFFQEKKGYKKDSDKKYMGDPNYYYLKYSFQASDKIAFGFTAKKDAGEPAWNENNKVFDFNSFYLQISGIGILEQLILGDYKMTFGQGLVIGTGSIFGKSTSVLNPVQREDGIRKYASTGESGFFRGIGTTLKHKSVKFTAFYSHNNIDANVSDEGFITSFKTDGLHRVEKEMAKKRNTKEEVVGGNFNLQKERLSIGATFVRYKYGNKLQPAIKPYNQHKIQQENSFWNGSIDYTFKIPGLKFFGEIARGKNKEMAFLNGLSLFPSSRMELLALYRNYSPGYQANYAGGFAENSRVENEKGLYLGVELKPVKRIKMAAYADVYRFPWLKYGVDKPSSGYDWLATIEYSLSSTISMNLKYKFKTKEENHTASKTVTRTAYNSIRYSVRSTVGKNMQIQVIADGNSYSAEPANTSYGWAIAQDFSWSIANPSFNLSFRYAYFNAPEYDNRIYLYEKDVLYAFSVPAYYGTGHRMYLNLRYNISPDITCCVKTGLYIYTDARETIGSGMEEVAGNILSNVRCLLRYKF
jgi:hypothetical protein